MKELTLKEYMDKAMSTCMPSCENITYMALNLVAEVGEFAGKIAKAVRKEQVEINGNRLDVGNKFYEDNDFDMNEFETALKYELGDIFWQALGICFAMGWNPEEVARMNLDKLAKRKLNGTIAGNGDGVTKEERK